uniref:Uncharacterized protein n=1 Tax=Tanacetum cinerariifolium TaxID=118510 RepID=A0A6L2NDG0_TANCI|nr:hypothetical protein [Tanacetum cinerariifolium]
MALFDYRLNPLYPIKEYSSCGALYTMEYYCSEGSLRDKIICDLNKTPDLSQRPPQNCPKCGNPVDGHYCQGCALLQKKFKEDLFTYCIEMEFSKILLSHPMTIPTLLMLFKSHSLSNKTPEEETQIEEEQAAKARYWKIPICYDDEDYAIAVKPILSIEDPANSLSMGDEHLDTIPATKSDEFIKSSVENLVPIPNLVEDFSDSNNDSTSIDDDSFSIDNIEYVEASPPDFELVSLERTLKPLIILYLNLKLFAFDLEENSSGSTTARSYISLPEYEAFYDDHVKEISSGSTTTHSYCSLYDSFIFDLSINPFPLACRSDFDEFIDELAHIISPPEYDCFCFKNEPNSGDFTMDVVEDIFPIREPRVHVYNVFPTHPTL